MERQYRQSIFTHELAGILAKRGLTIESLRRAPFNFDRQKVDRLERSLETLSQLPALSHVELMSLVLLLKLTQEERLRLYAALIALGTQRLLLDYLSPQRAWEIACEVRDAAFAWLRDHGSDEDVLRRRTLRGAEDAEVAPAGEEDALAPALEAYDVGAAALALGLFYGEGERGHRELERAVFFLRQALGTLEETTPPPGRADEWAYWRAEARRALDQAEGELG